MPKARTDRRYRLMPPYRRGHDSGHEIIFLYQHEAVTSWALKMTVLVVFVAEGYV